MRAFRAILVALAIALAAVAALHFLLGLGADRLLGIELDDAVIASPGLSSQNRFFGTSYLLYAVVLCLAARDLERYRPILLAVLVLTVVAGLSRVISWAAFGPPPPLVVALFLTEVLIPPGLILWLRALRRPVPAAERRPGLPT